MGCACLRGDGHHWPDRGARRVAAGGGQQGGLARQPDAAGPDARAQLLRPCLDADAVGFGDREEQPDADPHSYPNGVPYGHTLGKPIGDRHCECLGNPLPIAVSDGITLAERQRETLDLALNQAPPLHPTPGEQDRRVGPVVSASSQRRTPLTSLV